MASVKATRAQYRIEARGCNCSVVWPLDPSAAMAEEAPMKCAMAEDAPMKWGIRRAEAAMSTTNAGKVPPRRTRPELVFGIQVGVFRVQARLLYINIYIFILMYIDLSIYIYIYIYIYVHIVVQISTYIYIYMQLYIEREGER